MNTTETTIWKGNPSHFASFWQYLIASVLFLILAPGGIVAIGILALAFLVAGAFALSGYLSVKSTTYEVTSERIRCTSGILSKRYDEVELYRVRDTQVREPMLMRLAGLGSITVFSTDVSTRNFVLAGVPNPVQLREQIRQAVEQSRAKHRVRLTQIEG